MKILLYSLVFAVIAFFCWNTGIINRTEADDAFDYAWQAEQGGLEGLYHPHHLLYGSMAKGLYSSARAVGYEGRAYPLLRALSAFSAAGTLLFFFRFCRRRLAMPWFRAWLGSGLLLFSYGFWRYANEAEVILPACFFVLWAFHRVSCPGQRTVQALAAGVLCGVAVLVHIMNLIPILLAVPLLYLADKNPKGLGLCWLSATAILAAGYGLVLCSYPDFFLYGGDFHPAITRETLFRGGIGFSQSVVSANFMLGYQTVREALVNLFPSRMLTEEFYLGEHLPMGLVISASLSMGLLLVSLFITLFYALRNLIRIGWSGVRKVSAVPADKWGPPVAATVWFGGYALAVCLIEPENPEVWGMGLVPFWLMFCGWIVARRSILSRLWPVVLLAGLLWFHNYIGGILPLRNPEADYNRQKAAWIIQHAVAGDVVLTAGSPVFERYLRYYCRAQVDYLYEWAPEQFLQDIFTSGNTAEAHQSGTVYLFADVLYPPHSLALRFPSAAAAIAGFSEKLRPVVTQLRQDEFGGVYALKQSGAPPLRPF